MYELLCSLFKNGITAISQWLPRISGLLPAELSERIQNTLDEIRVTQQDVDFINSKCRDCGSIFVERFCNDGFFVGVIPKLFTDSGSLESFIKKFSDHVALFGDYQQVLRGESTFQQITGSSSVEQNNPLLLALGIDDLDLERQKVIVEEYLKRIGSLTSVFEV